MAIIKSFKNRQPQINESAFIAENAAIIGDVTIGEKASIWYGAVLRGDSDSIHIGARTNVQDNAVVHVDPGFPVSIGDDSIVGHLALVHGATIENNVLVGMHSTILNGAHIGEFSHCGPMHWLHPTPLSHQNLLSWGVQLKLSNNSQTNKLTTSNATQQRM